MKKNIVIIFLVLTLITPSIVGAQTVISVQNQEQLAILINQTIKLIEQLISKLTLQLNQLQAVPTTEETSTTTEEIIVESQPKISISLESLIYRFNDPELNGKYLADVTLKAKRNFIKSTLSYYVYVSDDSANRTQTTETLRSIDVGETVILEDIKYSIEMKDSNNRQVNISEWFEITKATATSNGESIGVEF